LRVAAGTVLPFTAVNPKEIKARVDSFNYSIRCMHGRFMQAQAGQTYILQMLPANQKLVVNCDTRF
jgi:hypothetical protein